MKPIVTHCSLRLGDNLAHVHFLRKLAREYKEQSFIHYAHAPYTRELELMVADQDRIAIKILPMDPEAPWHSKPAEPSIDAWKNAGGFFDRMPAIERNNYASFMLRFFAMLAVDMGLRSTLNFPEDLLFDYPMLKFHRGAGVEMLDFLIVNAPPMSGQAPRYDAFEMDRLIHDLVAKGYSCLATSSPIAGANYLHTSKWQWNVTQIGQISQNVRRIIMVSTGPSWPTFNVWNRESVELRIIINEPEIVDLDPKARQAHCVADVRDILNSEGLL